MEMYDSARCAAEAEKHNPMEPAGAVELLEPLTMLSRRFSVLNGRLRRSRCAMQVGGGGNPPTCRIFTSYIKAGRTDVQPCSRSVS
jgi:hypothetical protein